MTINIMNIMKLGLSQNLMIFEGSLVIILGPYFNYKKSISIKALFQVETRLYLSSFNANSAHYIHFSATRKIPMNKQIYPFLIPQFPLMSYW